MAVVSPTMSVARRYAQAARRAAARAVDTGTVERVCLAVAMVTLLVCLRDTRDIPGSIRYPLLAFSLVAGLRPAQALLVLCGLTGLGAVLPAVLGLVPGSAMHLIEVPMSTPRVGEVLVVAFLTGWFVRILATRDRVFEPSDRLVAPLVLFGAVTIASLLVSGAVSQLWVDPQQAYRAPVPALVVAGLFMDGGSMGWSRPAAAGILQGLLLFGTAVHLSRTRPSLPRQMSRMLAVGAAGVGVLASLQLGLDVTRYLQGIGSLTRLGVHLSDMNAAGSQFLLAAFLIAGFAAGAVGRVRRLWVAALAAVLGGLWLSGSRTAVAVGVVAVLVMVAVARVRRRAARSAFVLVLLLAVAAPLTLGSLLPGMPGNAASKSGLHRLRFLQTSLAMWSTTPVFGVGIGQYWLRSGDFMPPELRAIYDHENAHNNFAQYGAEMGIVGLSAFLWLVWRAALRVRRGFLATRREPQLTGLTAGLVAFLATCLTGHPLLVQTTAAVFWLALGAAVSWADRTTLASGAGEQPPGTSEDPTWRSSVRRGALAAAVAVILLSVYPRVQASRSEADLTHVKYGFSQRHRDSDFGREYWLAGPEATFFVRADAPGIQVSLGGTESGAPADVEIFVDHRLVGRFRVDEHRWSDHRVRLPSRSRKTPFVQVDLRVLDGKSSQARLKGSAAPRASTRVRVSSFGPVAVPSR